MNIPVKFKQGILIGSFATDPDGYDEGQIYWNTTDKKFRQYNGTVWADLKPTPAEFISADAGQTAIVGSDDKILVPQSSGGKQKYFVNLGGRVTIPIPPNFRTFNLSTGYYYTNVNAGVNNVNGLPDYSWNIKGVPIPKGYKLVSVEFQFIPPSGTTGLNWNLTFRNAPLIDENNYKIYPNTEYEGLFNGDSIDYINLYNDNYFSPTIGNEFNFNAAKEFKRRIVIDDTGGLNEASDNTELLFAISGIGNTANLNGFYALRLEIEEI